jgi:cytochrome P450
MQTERPTVGGGRRPRDPFRSLNALMAREGDVARYRSGSEEAYLVNHPDYIRHVLVDNASGYSKDTAVNANFKAAAADGILVSEGEQWRRHRRLMHPAFHRDRVAGFAESIVELTLGVMAGWASVVDTDQPIDLATDMATLTMLITAKVLFDADLTDRADMVGQAIGDALPKLVAPDKEEFWAAKAKILNVVISLVEERVASGRRGQDVLSMLIEARDERGEGLTTQEIQDEAMTLVLAGVETTANGLAWTWTLLMQHPEVAERLHRELVATVGGRLPTAADLPRLSFARMIFEEALRMYPPAWILGRRALVDDEIGGRRIPKGSVVAVSPYLLHRNTAFWEEPERFDPERFTAARTAGRRPFTYLPFGGGPRLCIGHAMAMVEAQLAIATIAARYRFELPPGQVVEAERLFVLRPRGGLPALVRTASPS